MDISSNSWLESHGINRNYILKTKKYYDKKEVMEGLLESAKKKIPTVDFILSKTLKKLNLTKELVEKNFGRILVLVDEEATRIYKEYEKKALVELAKEWLKIQKEEIRRKLKKIISEKGWDNFIEEASKLFAEFGSLVQALEKDLGNMRKARGGKTFEKTIFTLLNFLDIPAEIPSGKAKEKLKRIDIVIPDMNIALNTPDKAFFLTCKRTLRERWKQEVPQARLNQRIYLITIDEVLPMNKAKEINEKGLIAFVRDELTERRDLNKFPWIRKLSDLPKELIIR